MRAVADVNVLVSAVLSAQGPSAEILRASRDGKLELIVSNKLLAELARTLAYPKLRKRIPEERASAYVQWLCEHTNFVEDPSDLPAIQSRDPDDDYLLALAMQTRAYLVTGDQDLLVLGDALPILTPAQFTTKLRDADAN